MLFNGTPKDILIISSKSGIWNGGSCCCHHGMHDKQQTAPTTTTNNDPLSSTGMSTRNDDNSYSSLITAWTSEDESICLVYRSRLAV
jgi:hypothetical protein